MASRRLCYFLTLTVVFTAWLAVGSWLSWVVLLALLALPWLGLALSLPALRAFGLAPTGVDVLQAGEPASLWILGSCGPPMPPFRGELEIRSCFTGQLSRYRPEQGLPTAHCGGLEITVVKARVFDYLGLFSFRPRHREPRTVRIRPVPLEVTEPLGLEKFSARRWYPKPGGGFSENHELRPFRPGDSMTGIHWKLTAKTGALVVREPMEPEQGRMLLTMDVSGTPEELDRKFGRLVWVSRQLLDRGLHFELRVLTGHGLQELPVRDERSLNRAVDDLLCQPLAREGTVRDHPASACWQFHIGGEAL